MATRRTFGRTWWGNAWVEAMERIDYNTNRLPRGKRYASKGMVREIKIKNGDVSARVQGTRPSPYRVKISLKKFNGKHSVNQYLPASCLPKKLKKIFHNPWTLGKFCYMLYI